MELFSRRVSCWRRSQTKPKCILCNKKGSGVFVARPRWPTAHPLLALPTNYCCVLKQETESAAARRPAAAARSDDVKKSCKKYIKPLWVVLLSPAAAASVANYQPAFPFNYVRANGVFNRRMRLPKLGTFFLDWRQWSKNVWLKISFFLVPWFNLCPAN